MTLRVLTIGATKGGVGKTTLCECLAVEAASHGERVALLDLDPQRGSLYSWWVRRGSPEHMPCLKMPKGNLPRIVDGLGDEGFSLVIIDAPPAITNIIEPSIRCADLVLIPVGTCIEELESIDVVKETAEDDDRPFAFVLTRTEPRGARADDAAEDLGCDGDMVLKTHLTRRVAYETAKDHGKTGPEINPQAKADITAIWKEVARLLPPRKARA